MKNVISSIQLKRGTKLNLETILVNDKKPLKGEPVWELDTNKLKIGDGVNNYADLPYLENTLEISSKILRGYYEQGVFWKNESKTERWPDFIDKLYVDIPTNTVYYYSASDKRYVNLIALASSSAPGLVKLYTTTGQNEDGSMTQKAITNHLKEKVEVKTDELLSNESIEILLNQD